MPDQTPEPHAGVLPPCCREAHLRMVCETECGNCNVCRFTARIAELEAQSAADRNVARKLIDARARDIVAEEKPQAEPDAYIAVKRTHSPNADRPEWDWHATVIPAGDEFAEDRDWRADRGYELLPIVATETGTRPATPQSDPVGYAVGVDSGVGPVFVQTSPVLTRKEADSRATFYNESTDMDARVYELREVFGE